MKKISSSLLIRSIFLVLIACFSVQYSNAQSSGRTCELTIVGDFESSCTLPIRVNMYVDEYQEAIAACQGSTVIYRAVANTGSSTILGWEWSIQGESSYVDNQDGTVSVTWGTGQTGHVAVAITTSTYVRCSDYKQVILIENPTINVSTVPAYTEEDGVKIIYVCPHQDVEFIDMSQTTNSDIVGYTWQSDHNGSASTQNFTVRDVVQDDAITHRVYNNCGCYAEEVYQIKILDGDLLELSCYGTVCEDAVVTYTAQNPACSQYVWYVEGGSILGGQNTQTVTVQWDNPHNGYGVIGLDGILCDNQACPNMLSRKIPVIQEHIPIEGQTSACVGEAVVYSLPMFGSTEYTWTVTPNGGLYIDPYNGGNRLLLEFTQPGVWHVSSSYRCEFLDCGTYTSDTITVTVKPNLQIEGGKRICAGQSCDLATVPQEDATWKVYNMDNGDQLVATVTGSSQLAMPFATAGRYLVTAEHPSYCKPATFVLTVNPAPPAPVLGEMDPRNPHTACPGSSIRLKATPHSPNYSIVWEPVCASATPQHVAGNEVTVTYAGEVCNVEAYTYDPLLDCLSENAYVHVVEQFQLANVTIPSNITVCPGTRIVWSDNEVPYQQGVHYEWKIEQHKQYCASIQGSSLTNEITLQINELPLGNDYFTITLERNYCTEYYDYKTINVHIRNSLPGTPDFDDGDACQFDTRTILGENGTTGHYYWMAGSSGTLLHSDSYQLDTRMPGSVNLTLLLNSYDECSIPSYYNTITHTVTINPAPPVECLTVSNGMIQVDPPLPSTGYSCSWTKDGVAVPSVSSSIPYQQGSYYVCTVTDVATGCQKTIVECEDCEGMELFSDEYDYCSHELICTLPYIFEEVVWSVDPPLAEILPKDNPNGSAALMTFHLPGTYTVTAYVPGDPCSSCSKIIIIDCLPQFSFEKNCTSIDIHNSTHCLDPNAVLHFNVIKDNAVLDYINMPVSSGTTQYSITEDGSYVFVLDYITINNVQVYVNCTYGPFEITNSSAATLKIITENSHNQHKTCDNIPIMLSALLTPSYNISRTSWDFGDGASLNLGGCCIYHTFENDANPYIIGVHAFDENGCQFYDTIHIKSVFNGLDDNEWILVNPGSPICPNNLPVTLGYRHSGNVIPNQLSSYYTWQSPIGTSSNYEAYHTDNYYAYVENDDFCRGQAMVNVRFKNAPTAIIIPESYKVCLGDEITICGSPDPNPTGFTFSWTITDSASGSITTPASNPKIQFSPTTAGVYFIDLTVTNADGCSDAATARIEVFGIPPAPSVDFNGNECIHEPPVDLIATTSTPGADFHWSNGDNGNTAGYYYPGVATVYYYDPVSGCKSLVSDFAIQPEPDFDALLTGCYKKCYDFFPNSLQTWGLTHDGQQFDWRWYFNNSSIASNTSNNTHLILPLPSPGFGDYYLNVDYQHGSNCEVRSPLLTIERRDTCECEDIDISLHSYKKTLSNCILQYEIIFEICNSGIDTTCLNRIKLLTNSGITLNTVTIPNSILAPGNCTYATVNISVSELVSTSALFQMFDSCNNCTKVFSFDIVPTINCTEKMELVKLYCDQLLSNDVATYYLFQFDLPNAQQVLGFWSEPPSVINYSTTIVAPDATVFGLGMIDNALLSQLVATGENVCFYAIICNKDNICLYEYCMSAETFVDLCDKTRGSDSTDERTPRSLGSIEGHSAPQLMPNPTTGEVDVIGTTDEIVEVQVLDMNGRQLATFEATGHFNVSNYPSGAYIVRVKTRPSPDKRGGYPRDSQEKVTYLKLIKK